MILKKPYAFIIKYFKFIHFLLTLLVAYLIYRTNLILNFLSNYINSNISVIGQNLTNNLFNILCFIIPIVIVLFALIFIGIMYKKGKPYLFYIINIFIFVAFFVILLYSYQIINHMQTAALDIRVIKIIHDLLIILIGLEVISLIIFLIRAIGFDIKKFDFLSDVNKFDITDSDKEEFEFDIKIDFDERKRFFRRRKRYLKYAYKENKLFIIVCLIILILFGLYFTYKKINVNTKMYNEQVNISLNTYTLSVEESYITNKNYLNKKILDDNYLVIVKLKTKAFSKGQKLVLGDFKLKIDSNEFVETSDYKKQIKDLGTQYTGEELNVNNYEYYLISFLIPKNLVNKEMILQYNNLNKKIEIKLNCKKIDKNIKHNNYNIKNKISFDSSLIGDSNITVNSFEINDKFKIQYNFKSRNGNIYPSIEYLTPKVDSNYDKLLLKINAVYNKNDSYVENLNKLIQVYGNIKYKINNNVKIQNNLSLVTSTKLKEKNTYYIEINKEINNAESASLVFKIRNNEYEYILF